MIRVVLFASAILGAIVAAGTGVLLLVSEAGSFDPYLFDFTSIFPMPFLVLLEWAVFGIGGAISIIRTELRSDPGQLPWAWGIVGGYLPLMYFGALSIAPLVLICAVLLLVPTLVLSFRDRAPLLRNLAILGIGAIANYALVSAFVALGRAVR